MTMSPHEYEEAWRILADEYAFNKTRGFPNAKDASWRLAEKFGIRRGEFDAWAEGREWHQT